MPDPNKIEGGRWDRVLRALFNLKGSGPTAARISDDISPTFPFPWRLEDEFLMDERLMWGRAVTGTVAGQFPRINLTNASENMLVIVEKVVIERVGSDAFIQVQSGVIPALTERAKLVRDTRYADGDFDTGIGVVNFQGGTTAAVHTITNLVMSLPPFVRTTVTGNRVVELGVVLVPGQHFIILGTAAATDLEMTLFWREHKAEPGELPAA